MKPLKYSLLISLLIIGLSACQQGEGQGDVALLDSILANNELVVVTRNAPTTYYNLHDEQTGFEYDLTQAFASSLGVKVRYIVKHSTSEILSAIETNEAHLAAAGLTRTMERQSQFLFSSVYQQVQQQVVCRRGGANPSNVAELAGINLRIAADTSYAEKLQQLQRQNVDITWQAVPETGSEALLEEVWLKKIECTVADSNIIAINRRYYPELRVQFDLTRPEPLAWAMPLKASRLQEKMNAWFDEYTRSGELEILRERYYGHIDVFDYVDTRKFVRSIKKVLPKYQADFKKEAKKQNIEWSLLAAQAYQESHWRANAKSPTGVRGIMMLTRTTARELGIERRIDARQSIRGGAAYLSKLIKRIPEGVIGRDRIWFALAAYNVGMGHVYDARTLAKRLNKNPDIWLDVRSVLPLLAKKKYYKTLKYGYARGREPVRYVQRIRDYHDILLKSLNEI